MRTEENRCFVWTADGLLKCEAVTNSLPADEWEKKPNSSPRAAVDAGVQLAV